MIQPNTSSLEVIVDDDEYRVDEITMWIETEQCPGLPRERSTIVTGQQFLRLHGCGEIPVHDADTVLIPRKNLELTVEAWSTEANIATGREYEWTVEYLVVEKTQADVDEGSLKVGTGNAIEDGTGLSRPNESDESATITDYLSDQ